MVFYSGIYYLKVFLGILLVLQLISFLEVAIEWPQVTWHFLCLCDFSMLYEILFCVKDYGWQAQGGDILKFGSSWKELGYVLSAWQALLQWRTEEMDSVWGLGFP